jgi:hypothetical protein
MALLSYLKSWMNTTITYDVRVDTRPFPRLYMEELETR